MILIDVPLYLQYPDEPPARYRKVLVKGGE